MHDQKKISQKSITDAEKEARRAVEADRGVVYQSQLKRYKEKDFTVSALEENTRLLLEVPEAYTMYTYRRETVMHLWEKQIPPPPSESSTADAADDVRLLWLQEELKLNSSILMKDFKIYAAFVHRHWIFDTLIIAARDELSAVRRSKGVYNAESTEAAAAVAVADDDAQQCPSLVFLQMALAKEMKQCEKLLKLDERNFHAWNYRRWVMSTMDDANALLDTNEGDTAAAADSHPSFFTAKDAAELQYTKGKINSNFSNYSAWHQRALVVVGALQRHDMWPLEKSISKQRSDRDSIMSDGAWRELHEFLVHDTDLLLQAVYCDPNDQSAWFYAPFIVDVFAACEPHLAHLPRAPTAAPISSAVEAMWRACEGDIADTIFRGTVDLVVEQERLQDDSECYLPYYYLFTTLDRARDQINGKGSTSDEDDRRAMLARKQHRHVVLILDRIFGEATATADGEEAAEQRCIQQLRDRLTVSDAMRRGMYAR